MGRPRFYKSNKMVPTKEYKANWIANCKKGLNPNDT